MTAHELARKLLEMDDVLVTAHYPDEYECSLGPVDTVSDMLLNSKTGKFLPMILIEGGPE